MSVILTGINADIKCIDCPMKDLDDNCMAQEHSGDTWEEMKADCPLKSVDGLIEQVEQSKHQRSLSDDDLTFYQDGLDEAIAIIKEYCGM